jgi:hypothetical protein
MHLQINNKLQKPSIEPPLGQGPVGTKLGVLPKGRDSSKSPCQLSEEMLDCLISVYRQPADPSVTPRDETSHESPTSHFGQTDLLAGISMFADQSMGMSFVRSPLVDLRTTEEILGCDTSPNPFSTRGRIPWADIGIYGRVLEVPSPSSYKMGFATHAMNKFRYQNPCCFAWTLASE